MVGYKDEYKKIIDNNKFIINIFVKFKLNAYISRCIIKVNIDLWISTEYKV